MRFLLIDDDDDSCQLIKTLLTNDFKAEVTVASSGEEALYQLVSNKLPVDVILLDILMPEMNGIETCIRIREQANYEFTPIIFISSSNEKDHFMYAFYAGGTDFIRKPINKTELHTRIKLAIKNKGERQLLLQTLQKQGDLINKLNMTLEQLSGKITFDPATNLFSRSYMETLIQQEWLRQKRSQLTLAFILIRLEGVNQDTFKNIALTLESTCRRAADHLGIWNDNTFAALIADCKDNNFQKISEIFRSAISHFQGIQCFIGVSSCIPPINAGQAKDLIEGTQAALIEAKKQGPGSIEFKEVMFSASNRKASA